MFHRIVTIHTSTVPKAKPNPENPDENVKLSPQNVLKFQEENSDVSETRDGASWSEDLEKGFSNTSEVTSARDQNENYKKTSMELVDEIKPAENDSKSQYPRHYHRQKSAQDQTTPEVNPNFSLKLAQTAQHAEIVNYLNNKSKLVLSTHGVTTMNQIPPEKYDIQDESSKTSKKNTDKTSKKKTKKKSKSSFWNWKDSRSSVTEVSSDKTIVNVEESSGQESNNNPVRNDTSQKDNQSQSVSLNSSMNNNSCSSPL